MTSKNIGQGVLKLDAHEYISEDDYQRLFPAMSKSITRLESGDVLTGIIGTFENLYLYTGCERFGISSAIAVIRPDQGRIHPTFLYYYLSMPRIQSLKESLASGSVQGYTNLSVLGSLPVLLPQLKEQRAIAEVLGALDDKIAANANLVSLLGEHIDASFFSIVGPWRERIPLGELVSITKGVSYRSVDLVPSATALVTLKSIQRDGSYSTRGLKAFAGAFKDAQKIRGGEIVVAYTDLTQAADVVGRAVRVPASSDFDTLVASLDIAIVRPKPVVEQDFVLGVLRDRRFIEHCKSRTTGTTVLHLARDAIESFSAPEVSIEVQMRYAAVVAPMHHMRDALEREGEAVASMRDELLPRLMSGKIRVMHAEQMVGDVV